MGADDVSRSTKNIDVKLDFIREGDCTRICEGDEGLIKS